MLEVKTIDIFKLDQKKILLLRTSNLIHINEICNLFKGNGKRFDILTQKDVEINQAEENIFFEKTGFFNIWKISFRWLCALRRKKYNAVLVPYNNKDRCGYFQLELLSFLINPKRVIGITHTNEFFEIRFFCWGLSCVANRIVMLLCKIKNYYENRN